MDVKRCPGCYQPLTPAEDACFRGRCEDCYAGGQPRGGYMPLQAGLYERLTSGAGRSDAQGGPHGGRGNGGRMVGRHHRKRKKEKGGNGGTKRTADQKQAAREAALKAWERRRAEGTDKNPKVSKKAKAAV